jgi:Tol biopolymer transport system component
VSANGVLAYNSFENQRHTLQWFDRTGRALDAVGEQVSVTHFRIAPDGRRVVAALQDFSAGTRSLWVLDPPRPARRLTFAATHDWEPVWSPDGMRVAFASYRDGPLNLYMKAAAGSGGDEPLVISENQKNAGDWSADGRFFAYRMVGEDTTHGDIWVLPLDGKRTAFPIAMTPGEERDPRFAPDTRWIAYESDETGRSEIYVTPFPPTGAKWQVSSRGGRNPAWQGDGRELFFVAPEGVVTAVPVEAKEALEIGPATALFRLPARGGAADTQFDVTRDGQRFLVRVPVPESPPSAINMVINWPALLQK